MGQMGFFDISDRYASLDAKRDPMIEIDAIVPWEQFRATLERVWRKPPWKRCCRWDSEVDDGLRRAEDRTDGGAAGALCRRSGITSARGP